MSASPTSERQPVAARRVSRAPVVVVAGGLTLALALVLLGARLAEQPARAPDLSSPGTSDRPRQVSVILRDYAFNPTPLYLVAGETVSLVVINAGLVEHELVLGDADVQAAWALADALATPPGLLATAPPASVPLGTAGLRVLLDPGEQASLRYEVPAAEQLQLFCHLPGHVEQGMVGEVVVVQRNRALAGAGGVNR